MKDNCGSNCTTQIMKGPDRLSDRGGESYPVTGGQQIKTIYIILSFGSATEIGLRPPYCWGIKITLRHTTFDRTPLNEGSALCRDLCLTTHNIQERQISLHPAGCESTIPASERPDTYALDYAAIKNIGQNKVCPCILRAFVILCVKLRQVTSYCCVTGWLWQPHVATQRILNINISISRASYTNVPCEVEAAVYSSLWIHLVNCLWQSTSNLRMRKVPGTNYRNSC
jgi:hypothetical protein